MTPDQITAAIWLLKASGVFIAALASTGYVAYRLWGKK